MDRFEFQHDVTVEGVAYSAGDQVDADAIPQGCLESCLRVGHLAPVLPLASEPESDEPAAEPSESDELLTDEASDEASDEGAGEEAASEPKRHKRRR